MAGIFTSLSLSLFGCNETKPEGSLISLKLSGAGTTQKNHYYYHLREENKKILFDAYYRTYYSTDEYRAVKIENAAATKDDLIELRKRVDKWISEKKDTAIQSQAQESGDFFVEAVWDDQLVLNTYMPMNADSNMDGILMHYFFQNITKRLADCYYDAPEKIMAEGDIVSLKVSYSSGGMERTHRFIYYIREENGKVLFDAHRMSWHEDYRTIHLERVFVTQDELAAINKICVEHSLNEDQKAYAAPKPEYINPPWQEATIKAGEHLISDGPPRRSHIAAIWENGAEYDSNGPGKILNALEGFFYALLFQLDSDPPSDNPDSAWECSCGAANKGRFCTECAAPKTL